MTLLRAVLGPPLLMFGGIFATALIALSTEASADNKVCYWNAEGLPYSKAPPPDAGESLFPGGPMQAIRTLLNASPQLIYKQACGLVAETDLDKPREIYRRWGCPPDSSVGQMIEGLASGGVLVSPAMSSVEYLTSKYADEFNEHCKLLEGIDPICYLVSGNSPNPNDMEKYPQCDNVWLRIVAFEAFWAGIGKRESAAINEFLEDDQALIESADVE